MTFASRFLGQALKLPPVASRDIDVQRDLRARMPDGAVLLADRYARNPGTGEPLGTVVRLVPARQQVLRDPGHPSALILPVPP